MSQELDFIEHYGKKGMKWGVKGSRLSKPKRKLSSDYRETVPLRNRNPKELSNKQISKVAARIRAEQNYKHLNPSKVTKGQTAVKSLLGLIGTAGTVYGLSKTPLGKIGVNAIKNSPAGKSYVKVGARITQAMINRKSGSQLKLF